jgi:hypothetical protein
MGFEPHSTNYLYIDSIGWNRMFAEVDGKPIE